MQRIQNVAARLVFNLPKFSHVTPLFRDLHWLPVVARIRFKMMVLAYKAVDWNCPCLTPSIGKATHPNSIPPLNYLSSTSGTAIAKSKQRSINKVTTLLCFGTSVVERAPCRCQDRRVAHQLPQKTQNSPVQSSPRPCVATQPLPATIVCCTSLPLMYALIVRT